MEYKLFLTLLAIAFIATDYALAKDAVRKKKNPNRNAVSAISTKARSKQSKRILHGGDPVDYIPPPMAVMYESVGATGTVITMRCQGVLIAPDLILTSEECRRPIIGQAKTSVYWDVARRESLRTESDQDPRLFSSQEIVEASPKKGDFSRFPSQAHCDNTELIVYEFARPIQLYQNFIYEAKLITPDMSIAQFNNKGGSCRIFAYGGNNVLRSMKVEETQNRMCTQGITNTENIACLVAVSGETNEYNLCQLDAGAPILCSMTDFRIVDDGEKGDLGDIFVYGFVTNLNPGPERNVIDAGKCDIKYSKSSRFIPAVKVSNYYSYLTDLLYYKDQLLPAKLEASGGYDENAKNDDQIGILWDDSSITTTRVPKTRRPDRD